VTGGLGFVVEVGLDRPLTSGVIGGNAQELPHCAWGLIAERVDEHLAGHAIDEDVDDVSVDDARDLVVLLGKALDVLLMGLVGPLPTVAEVS
jgi:hypothetical protein